MGKPFGFIFCRVCFTVKNRKLFLITGASSGLGRAFAEAAVPVDSIGMEWS
jgi:hypothetical protein